ncbi:MAG: acyltransferase, partial [Nocardioides sp.]|nr:acyltransferase [Nocardioides sp.]
DPNGAYFSPFTRGWELGLGCLAAIAFRDDGVQNSTARWRAQVLAAFGMFFIICAVLQFNDATPFPGTPALVPVLGSVFILVAGTLWHGPTVVSRILGVRPLQVLGDWSYSLYLWHFPVLTLAALKLGRDLRWWEAALLVALAVLLAALSYRFVEEPIRRGSLGAPKLWSGRALPVALYPISLALVAATCLGANTYATATARDGYQPAIKLAEGSSAASPSASAAGGSARASTSAAPGKPVKLGPPPPPDPIPALVKASVVAGMHNQPIPSTLHPAVDGAETDVEPVGACNYYAQVRTLCPRGDTSATKSIVVIGDSHGRHWIPAVEKIATQSHYKTYYLDMPQCPIALLTPDALGTTRPFNACASFHTWMLNEVKAIHPDVLLISSRPLYAAYHDATGRHTDPTQVRNAIYASYLRLLSIVKPAAKRTVWLRDIPADPDDPSTCLSQNKTLGPCLFKPLESQQVGANLQMQAARATGTETLDLDDLFCYEGRCTSVVGDMINHRDTHHITATYSAALGRTLGERLHLW